MLSKCKIITSLLLLQFSHSIYAACCVQQYSEIDGVVVDSATQMQSDKLYYTIGIAGINENDKNSLANYNRTKKFIASCQAHHIFYVDVFGDTPFRCAIDETQKIDLSDQGGNPFTLQATIPINLKQYLLLGNPFGMDLNIISTKPLKYKKIVFNNLKGKELSYYSKLAQQKTKKIKIPAGYLKANRLKNQIYRSPESREMLPKKYHQNGFEFIFVPAYTIEDELSLDLVSAVFIKNKQGKVDYLGENHGCIVRPTVDVNNDGFSELVVAECEPGESGETSVNSVYPKIKSLASWITS